LNKFGIGAADFIRSVVTVQLKETYKIKIVIHFIDWTYATFAMLPVILFITFPSFQVTNVSDFNNKRFTASVNIATVISPMNAVTVFYCY
jgi:hypothetical protein